MVQVNRFISWALSTEGLAPNGIENIVIVWDGEVNGANGLELNINSITVDSIEQDVNDIIDDFNDR